MKARTIAVATGLFATGLVTMPSAGHGLQQAPTLEGRWDARLDEWNDEARVQLNLRVRSGGERSNSGRSYEADDLPVLAQALGRGGRTDVAFSIVREAGRIDFDGTTDGDEADGDFTWTGSTNFLSSMGRLGYDDLSPLQQFGMTMQDITVAFTRAMQDRGYDVPADELIRFGLFGVTPEFVDALAGLGHARVESEMLVKLRIHGATPTYIADMSAAGYDGELEDYVRFRIHGVDSEFAGAMARALGQEIDSDDVVRLRIHGIDAEYVRQLGDLARLDASMEDMVRMKIHGVSAAFVREMIDVGYANLSADDLVRFRIHGVEGEFVRDLASRGYRDLTADELVRAKIMGRVGRRNP